MASSWELETNFDLVLRKAEVLKESAEPGDKLKATAEKASSDQYQVKSLRSCLDST